jgi:hypothetical protein
LPFVAASILRAASPFTAHFNADASGFVPVEGLPRLCRDANNYTTSACIFKIHRDVSTDAGCGRKNHTLDSGGDPNGSELLGCRILWAAEAACHDVCQLEWKRCREVEVPPNTSDEKKPKLKRSTSVLLDFAR